MFNTEIIYTAMKASFEDNLEIVDSCCLMCGKEIKAGIKVKKVLSGNFTNLSECKDLKSEYVCKECTFCLKNADLRKNNIICDKEHMYLLKKNELENYLFNLEKYLTEKEFLVAVTTSFKKHNTFRCKVNSDYKKFYIREEDKEYLFDVKKMKYLYKLLNKAYLYFSKEEIKSGQYNLISLEQFGIEKFNKYETEFKKYRGSHQFNFLIYILNSEKRNEYVQAKIKAEKEEKSILKVLEKEEKIKKNNKTKKNKKEEGDVEQICMI